MASTQLILLQIGHGLAGLGAVVLVYVVLGERSPVPALILYGVTFLVPIALLQIVKPLPVGLRLVRPQRDLSLHVLRFSLPIWGSHISYVLYAGIDILLIERFLGTAAVGRYALTKTLTQLLTFVPMGITTMLLPRVAAQRDAHLGRMLLSVIAVSVVINLVAMIALVVVYRWFIGMFFDPAYDVGIVVLILMSLSEVIFGIHTIVTAALIGRDKPQWETASRAIIMVVAVALGIVLIPAYGLSGAALTLFVSGIVANLTYAAAVLWMKWNKREMRPIAAELR
jgi:O-antigen/teichoic acid export membrane protein